MALLMACAEDALPVSEELKDELVAEFGWIRRLSISGIIGAR